MEANRLAKGIGETSGYRVHDSRTEQGVQRDDLHGGAAPKRAWDEPEEIDQEHEHEACLPRKLPDHEVGELVPPRQGPFRPVVDTLGAVRDDR